MVAVALDVFLLPQGGLDPLGWELVLEAEAWGLLGAYAENPPFSEADLAGLAVPQVPCLPLEAAALTGYLVLARDPRTVAALLALGGRAVLVGRERSLPHLNRPEELLGLARPYQAAPRPQRR